MLSLGFLYVASLSEQEKHITLTDGVYPQPAGVDGPVELLMREDRANELGIQAGEEYTLLAVLETGGSKTRIEILSNIYFSRSVVNSLMLCGWISTRKPMLMRW